MAGTVSPTQQTGGALLSEELEKSLLEAAQADARSVEAKRPAQAAQALMMLCDGMSERAVERATGISATKISARCLSTMKQRHAEFLQVGRAEAARRAARLASKAESVALQKLRLLDPEEAVDQADRTEREEALKKLNPRDVLVTYGVASDKMSQLETPPEMVSDHSKVPTLEACQAAIETAKAEVAVRQEAEADQRKAEIEETVQRKLAELEDAQQKIVDLPGARAQAERKRQG